VSSPLYKAIFGLGLAAFALLFVVGIVQSLLRSGRVPSLVLDGFREVREAEQAGDWALASILRRKSAVVEAHAGSLARAAQAAVRAGRPELEIEALRPYLALAPRAADQRARLAQRLYEAGEVDEALWQLERAVRSGRSSRSGGSSGEDLQKLSVLVSLLEAEGHYERALPYHDQMAAQQPGSHALLARAGAAHAEHGDPARAIAHLRSALALDPAHAADHYWLARALARRGDAMPEAMGALDRALEIEPGLEAARALRAELAKPGAG